MRRTEKSVMEVENESEVGQSPSESARRRPIPPSRSKSSGRSRSAERARSFRGRKSDDVGSPGEPPPSSSREASLVLWRRIQSCNVRSRDAAPRGTAGGQLDTRRTKKHRCGLALVSAASSHIRFHLVKRRGPCFHHAGDKF